MCPLANCCQLSALMSTSTPYAIDWRVCARRKTTGGTRSSLVCP
jgi:hypothetical protein